MIVAIKRDIRMTLVFGIICGVFAGAIFGILIGRDIQRAEFERVGTAMDQADKRHQAYLDRQQASLEQADKRMDFIVQCAKRAEHLDDTSDKLAFCERQAPKHP